MNISHSLIIPSLDQFQQELDGLASCLDRATFNDKDKKEMQGIIQVCNHLISEVRNEVSNDQSCDASKYRNVFRQIKLGARSLKRRFQREVLNQSRFPNKPSSEAYVSKAAA